MARSRWTDPLQSHLFWAMDVSGEKSFPVFTPLFGFSGISAPRIQVEVETFKDGTYIYPRNVVKSASVGEVTFTRAATLYDSDFYDWIYHAIYGTTVAKDDGGFVSKIAGLSGKVRRDIVLFQFARVNLASSQAERTVATAAFGALVGAISASGSDIGTTGTGAAVGVAAGIGAAALGSTGVGIPVGPFTYAAWLPARAWLLHSCIPISYTAGSDFDATNASVSLMNLSVAVEWIEEFSCGVKP